MRNERTVIAIDYDYTWTTDPEFFLMIAIAWKARGHEVYIVTLRDCNDPIEDKDIILSKGIDIIYTSGEYKSVITKHNKIDVDIWIDDQPQWIIPPEQDIELEVNYD